MGVEGELLPPARDGAVSRGELKAHWPVEEGAGAGWCQAGLVVVVDAILAAFEAGYIVSCFVFLY